jgi:L-ascorbate metabolism protein UlaG (beta-lactamase superfamily)
MLRGSLAAVATALVLLPATAFAAGCFPIATAPARTIPAGFTPAALPEGATARPTFLGHASFLLETRGGVSAVTDYNGYNTAPITPDIVTMNNAHSTHFTDNVEPRVTHVLRGWVPGGGLAEHDVTLDDLRVRNVPTSVRGREGARTNSNSIFVFEVEDLCLAHLGHLHHRLEDYHLAEMGVIDVLLVPVDGMWTLPHAAAADVVDQVGPALVIPMHYFGRSVLEGFLAELSDEWEVVVSATPTVTLARDTLPFRRVLVLPGS